MNKTRKKISIISPCYNESHGIYKCHSAIKDLFSNKLNSYTYEHIFCDNSSSDDSKEILRKIAKEDKNAKIVFNASNYGSQKSIFNTLKYASGDAVILFLPIDLQDPPHLIDDFIKKWESGYDFVYGTRDKRSEFFIMKFIRKLFYSIIFFSSSGKVPKNISDFQLVDKKILKEMLNIDDKNPFIRTLAFLKTDNHIGISYEWRKRKHGKSKEFFRAITDIGINGFISVTNAPFRIVLYSGFLVSIFSILFAIFNIIQLYFFRPDVPRGIPIIIVSIFFLSGIQLLVLGYIGEYISSINNQVRNKNDVNVRETLNFEK